MGKQHAQRRRLELVEARVVADLDVNPGIGLAVRSKRPGHPRDVVVVGQDRSGVADCAEVLAGVEAEAGRVAERARAPALVARPGRLGGVLEHEQPVGARQLDQLAHRSRVAEQVDRDQRARAAR